jgi:hypothetical protein
VGFTYGLFSVTDRWKTKASKNQAVHNVVQSSVPAIFHRKLLCTRDHRFLLHFQDLVNLVMNIDESEEEGLDVVAQGGIKGGKTLILQDREIVELLTVGKEFSEWSLLMSDCEDAVHISYLRETKICSSNSFFNLSSRIVISSTADFDQTLFSAWRKLFHLRFL